MEYKVSERTIIGIIIKMIEKEIDSYSEDEKKILLNDKEEKCLINYVISTKELYFDHSLRNYILGFMKFIPPLTFHESLKIFFNSHFPDKEVKRVIAANIVMW